MRVVIDAEACTGHGRCYSLAPELFQSDLNGHGELVGSDVPPELEASARKAITNCPERAITLTA